MGQFAGLLEEYKVPSMKETPSDFLSLLPEERRGFVNNIKESWKRGKQNILADIAVYEAMQSGEGIEDVLRLRKKYQRQSLVDPVEGNFLTNLVYKSVNVLPGWMESSKEAIDEMAFGAAAGAGFAAVAGQLGPQVALPEEVITVPAGAVKGAKVGYTIGSADFWYRQGAGSMYADMIEKGYDPEKSATIAKIAAIPYAALEFLQMKTALPKVGDITKKTTGGIVKKFVKNFGSTYLKTLGSEVSEEVAQEIVQIAAEDIAGIASGMNIDFDKEYFLERAKRLGQIASESTQAFALMALPRASVQATMQTSKLVAEEQVQAETKNVYQQAGQETSMGSFPSAEGYIGFSDPVSFESEGNKFNVDYSDKVQGLENVPTDPLGKLQFVLRNSADKYLSMKVIHNAELGEKFANAEDALTISQSASEGFKKAIGKMRGKLTELKLNPSDIILTGEDWESLYSEIRDAESLSFTEKIRLQQALYKLTTEGRLPRPNEIKLAGKLFGLQIQEDFELVVDAVKKQKRLKKTTTEDIIRDAMGIPRALSATADVSRIMRQNILLIGSPKAFFKGMVDSWKIFLKDESYAKAAELASATSPYAHIRRRTNLKHNLWGERGTYRTRPEMFPTTKLEKVPLVARSERAFTVGGNVTRDYKFDLVAAEWENDTTRKYTMKDYNDVADFINFLTGEGDAKWFGEHAAFFNAAFFAPRLLHARFSAIVEALPLLLQAPLNKISGGKFEVMWGRSLAARKVLASHILKFVAINSGILLLASQIPGASVETDPRSTEFGKIKFGNTRIDFWGGYQPIARFVTELVTGQHKTSSGELITQERKQALTSFLQSKLAPIPAFAIDWSKGETFYGKEVPHTLDGFLEQAYNRLTPFVIQDIVDAARFNGLGTAAVVAPLAFNGVGTISYEQTPQSKLTEFKNKISAEVFGKKWKDIGQDAQAILREYYPEINKQELLNDFDYKSPKYLKRIVEEEYASEKRILKNLPTSLRTELKDNKISIGGVGKRVGSDWYLNDDRFKKYETTFTRALKKVLPILFKTQFWEEADVYTKQIVTADIVAELKKYVRNGIVEESNIQDLKYLLEK
jgi:hypothetical protein